MTSLTEADVEQAALDWLSPWSRHRARHAGHGARREPRQALPGALDQTDSPVKRTLR